MKNKKAPLQTELLFRGYPGSFQKSFQKSLTEPYAASIFTRDAGDSSFPIIPSTVVELPSAFLITFLYLLSLNFSPPYEAVPFSL